MFGFGKSENLKNFELITAGMEDRNEIRATSSSVYKLWKLFNARYKSIQIWLKSQDNQDEWLNFLVDLAKNQLEKEMEEDLQYGTTSGVYLTYYFFKALSLKESAKSITVMSDSMDLLNQIGYKIHIEKNNT
ncbi:MAG: hypothetical protein KJO26_11570 [Deltaproteobacteria bacterium]|nr:hypothetical protein [Deltaproteobacteria bacterium]